MLPQVQLISDVALLNSEARKVLLVRYRRRGYDTGWYLPDVLLNLLEHPDEGAKRVLWEQLGSAPSQISLSHVESFEAEGFWHLAFHYKAESDDKVGDHASTDIAELRWFPVDELPDFSDVGFNGWALKTLGRILKASECV